MEKKQIAIVFLIVCFLLVFSIFIQVKTVNEMKTTTGTSLSQNGELIDEVFKTQEKCRNIYKQLEDAEKKLEVIREKAIAGDNEDLEAENELKENNLHLGLTEVEGEGIIIVLDDNRNLEGEVLNISQYLVHAEDLLYIVNELFNAGAEAISINNQRIVNTTSILCNGNVIRINGEIVTVPIEIKAICSKAIYNTIIRPDGYLQLMVNEGVIATIDKKDSIKIPKYNGIYNHAHLTRGDE